MLRLAAVQGACPLLQPPESDGGIIQLTRLARPEQQVGCRPPWSAQHPPVAAELFPRFAAPPDKGDVLTLILHVQHASGRVSASSLPEPCRSTMTQAWPQDGQPYLLDVAVSDVVPESGDFSLYFINCQPQSAVSFLLQARRPLCSFYCGQR